MAVLTKRLLVVGCRGNLGLAVGNEAAGRGWEVWGWFRPDSNREVGYQEMALDAADPDEVELALRGMPDLDMIVFAQGTQKPALLVDSMPSFISLLRDNLFSAYYPAVLAMQLGKMREGSLMVFCSSIQAACPRPGRGCYAMAKAALEALARAVAVEGAPACRAVALRMGQLSEPMRGIVFSSEELQRLAARTFGPWPTPEQVAKLILDLYEQPAMTGAVIDLDGGHHLNVW